MKMKSIATAANHQSLRWLAPLLSLLIVTSKGYATDMEAVSPLTEDEKSEIIRSIGRVLKNNYYKASIGARYTKTLSNYQRSGRYAQLSNPTAFANKVSSDLRHISKDLHFNFEYMPKWAAANLSAEQSSEQAAIEKAELENVRRGNHGFKEVRILEGNVGYIKLNYFANPDSAHKAAATAMAFVENTDALIFDLRANNGGYLEMVQLLASYLFSVDKPLPLLSYYTIEEGERVDVEERVLSFVPGERTPQKPVYVLTSSTSFSGAEWFAYVLQNQQRATIVGERTAGGAHPVENIAVDANFRLQTPIGEVRDAITGQDFEREGVKPDVDVPSSIALEKAHLMAIAILAKNGGLAQEQAQWLAPRIAARMKPILVTTELADSIVGDYGDRSIRLEDGRLVYSWADRFSDRLHPLSPSLFALENVDVFRFQLISEGGKTVGLQRVFDNGSTQLFPRN